MENRFQNYVLLILVIYLNISCTTLKKSQVKLIGNYYNTLANYPTTVRKFNESVALLSLESQNLSSALENSDSARIHSLVSAILEFDENLIMPDSIIKELDVMEEYIRNYYVLAPNGFNIYKAIKSTSESIVGIFGFKSVVSAIMPDRDVEISSLKKRKIATHFRSQSDNFRYSLMKVGDYLDSQLLPSISQSNSAIQVNVEELFRNGQEPVSSLDHYFNYNRYFINLFQRIIQTRKLYESISRSIQTILNTEQEIQKMTAERDKLSRDSKQLHKLAAEIEKIKSLSRAIDHQE